MIRFKTKFTYHFDEKYTQYPNSIVRIFDFKYPILNLTYIKGKMTSVVPSGFSYDFDQFEVSTDYSNSISDKGLLNIYALVGVFLGNEISIVDAKYFLGNRTHLSLGKDLYKRFNLLPYYRHLSDNSYYEGHITHHFKGYILNKVPLLNKLGFHTVAGAHLLARHNRLTNGSRWRTYNEYVLGIENIGFWKVSFS